jgi:hypothetical protein
MRPIIYFFIPIRLPAQVMQGIDQVAVWQRADGGKYSVGASHWTLQTYVYLKEYGFTCEPVERLPDEGIILAHRDLIPDRLKPLPKQLLICLQADRPPHPHAQLSVVHNPRDPRIDMETVVYIPPWPQIGMLPRSEKRRDVFENIAYLGWKHNLAAELQDARWYKSLRSLGLRFQMVTESDRDKWRDFSNIDAVIAVRSFASEPYYDKPALKLFNAWHAGVPAILGVESAYRAERKSHLDYIEVRSIDEVISALLSLRDNKGLRDAMIHNGRERAKETEAKVIVSLWINMLNTVAIPRYCGSRLSGPEHS